MDELGQDYKFAMTEQADIISILAGETRDVLFNYIWENGEILKRITTIGKGDNPLVLAGKHGYDHRSNQIISNQISVAEITNSQVMTPGIFPVTMLRYNTEITAQLSYEVSKQSFIKDITLKELRNACINSIERAILYGTPTKKGIMNKLADYKKNWSSGSPPPQGSGGWFSAQGIYTMFYQLSEAGYNKKNTVIFAGSKAYHQLAVYRVAGATSTPLVSFDNTGNASIMGVPMIEVKALDKEYILYGDPRMLFVRLLDLSYSAVTSPSSGSITISYNSALEAGFADEKAFIKVKVPDTNHDKNA